MKKALIMSAATLILMSGCHKKKIEFASPDRAVVATVTEGGHDWKITDSLGNELMSDYDSMRVVETSPSGHPMTLYYCRGNERHWFQYYSNMSLRCEGTTVDGKRTGRWVYYHPNGMKQSEATFANGLEEGVYTVYRENGLPYYRGTYAAGKPTGTWEFYAPDGTLEGTKEY